MGALDALKARLKYSSRVRLAAKQMYKVVQQGVSFEVPNGAGTDDTTTRAVLCLRETYPGEVDVVYQSRGIIIGPVKKTMSKVSKEGWKELEKGNYMPEAGLASNAERFIADQHAWAAMQGLSRDEEAKEGQRRQAERDRIVLGKLGSAVEAERTAVPKRGLSPEELLEQAAEAAMHKNALEAEAKRRAAQAASGAPMPRGHGGPQPHAAFIDGPAKVEGKEVVTTGEGNVRVTQVE